MTGEISTVGERLIYVKIANFGTRKMSSPAPTQMSSHAPTRQEQKRPAPPGGNAVLMPPIRVQTFLANLPLFKDLNADEIERVGALTRLIRAQRGEILYHRGDPSRGMHIIAYGQVKLSFTSPRGDEKVLDILGPGSSFGEPVMFTERMHLVTAQALSDALIIFVAKEAIFDELERDARFARRMLASLSRRLHYLMADLEACSMRSGTERVIGYLLGGDRDAPPVTNSIQVTLPTTKGVIASRLNLTQEHFSRILHELSAKGLIQVRGRAVHIKDVAKLRGHTPC